VGDARCGIRQSLNLCTSRVRVERQRSQSRTADGGAITNGKTYGTAVAAAVGFIVTIDVSGSTTISRGDCP
jgi:hypothetical protein